jgi:hypothetical protein
VGYEVARKVRMQNTNGRRENKIKENKKKL